MKEILKYHVPGYQITVFLSSYLIEAKPENQDSAKRDKVEELPDWIFHSKHAIWLSEESAPLSVRAVHGEEIKRELLAHH